MDPLAQDDLTSAQKASPEEKLRLALELMAAGFRLERAALRQRHPHASEEDIIRLFEDWLTEND